jgi:hypothetical protein
MAGRDEQRGTDLDDWFAEPEAPPVRRTGLSEPRAETEVLPAVAPPAIDDDWIAAGDERPAREARFGLPAAFSEPRVVVIGAVALFALLVIGLAVAGVFNSSTPRPAATPTVSTQTTTTGPASTGTTPPATATRAPSGTLKPGDTGTEVKALQRALAALGYAPGAIDGSYGLSTERAVSRFQSFVKLTPDGVLGPQTLAALSTALGKLP